MGQDPSRFWGLSLREIDTVIRACAERSRQDHNDRAWLAHTVAALSRVKRLPKLKTLMIAKRGARPRPQTADEQKAIARQWVAATSKPSKAR